MILFLIELAASIVTTVNAVSFYMEISSPDYKTPFEILEQEEMETLKDVSTDIFSFDPETGEFQVGSEYMRIANEYNAKKAYARDAEDDKRYMRQYILYCILFYIILAISFFNLSKLPNQKTKLVDEYAFVLKTDGSLYHLTINDPSQLKRVTSSLSKDKVEACRSLFIGDIEKYLPDELSYKVTTCKYCSVYAYKINNVYDIKSHSSHMVFSFDTASQPGVMLVGMAYKQMNDYEELCSELKKRLVNNS